MVSREHWTKRAFDIVVATAGLVFAVPVILVLAVIASVSLRTTRPFFVHERVGRDGRHFRFVKIRTLPPTTVGPYQDKHSVDHHHLPRVLQAIRLMHLDELPQLALVLRGTMSLVGPRPEMPHLHDALEPGFAATRTRVRPGCTGLWQVGPGCTGEIGERPEYDTFYVERHTIAMDLWILWATVGKVLFTRTTDLDAVPRWALRGHAVVEPVTTTAKPVGVLSD